MRGRWLALSCLAGFIWVAQAEAELERSQVTVATASGQHVFNVEIADDPEERTQGLMHRQTLDDDAGMLFDFGKTQPQSMWMKNTLISLDILFADEKGRIVAIAHRAIPGSRRRIKSGQSVSAVLEIPGGRARELDIRPGDKLVHAIFDSGA